jgi:hypothetical protein
MGVTFLMVTGLLLAMQDVALTFALVHKARQAHHAAGAADVFKLHVAHQASGLGRAFDRAGGAIPAAAGGRGHEHVERVKHGFGLSPSGQGHRSTSGSAEGHEVAFGNGHAGLLCENQKATAGHVPWADGTILVPSRASSCQAPVKSIQ